MMYKYVRFDADSIGDKIELALLQSDIEEAQRVHDTVQKGFVLLKQLLFRKGEIEILMVGSDDILLRVELEKYDLQFIETLRNHFYELTKYTISGGIGNTIQETMLNLTKAKLLGRNRIIAS